MVKLRMVLLLSQPQLKTTKRMVRAKIKHLKPFTGFTYTISDFGNLRNRNFFSFSDSKTLIQSVSQKSGLL